MLRILKIGFKILTGVIIISFLIDISIRIVWKITTYNTGKLGYGLYVNDKIRGFQHNINYQYHLKRAKIKTKCLGNRNRIEADGKKIPIYVLGDSQVDNLVPDNRLFTYLLNKNNSKYYYYNFGVAAYSTLQELLSLESYHIPYRSQALLIFYLGNDLQQLFD
ncbi:hypothetical protein J7L48_05820, partial [bacterium]|nr:hypothetical protein [bacterium]